MQVSNYQGAGTNTKALVDRVTSGLQSGVPFELPVPTADGEQTVKGTFSFGMLQPAGHDIFFTPGQSGAPEAAKQALADSLQHFLALMALDAQAGSGPQGSKGAQTYATNTSFQGQNSAFVWSANFSTEPGQSVNRQA